MEEILLELAKSFPVIAVLLFWIRAERQERLELKAYHRETQEKNIRVYLALLGKDIPND